MQDVHIQTETLTTPLRLAMIGSKVAAVLKGIHEGKPLSDKGKQSLRIASEMLDQAARGATVLRDRSMAEYSAEAMSAYCLVQETNLPGAETREPAVVVERLKELANGLRGLAEDRQQELPLLQLQQFFTNLTRRSLDESVGAGEEVVRIG